MVLESARVFDKSELHTDCTVQILTNSITGEYSIGWKPNDPPTPKIWQSADDDPPEDNCYLVLWKNLEPQMPPDRGTFYEIVWWDSEHGWDTQGDIPQSVGGAEVLFWMELPDAPEVM
jgi:hypothetical protein